MSAAAAAVTIASVAPEMIKNFLTLILLNSKTQAFACCGSMNLGIRLQCGRREATGESNRIWSPGVRESTGAEVRRARGCAYGSDLGLAAQPFQAGQDVPPGFCGLLPKRD